MRDVDDRDAVVPQPPNELEQPLALHGIQGGVRFVEDDDIGTRDRRPRDLDDLPIREPQGADTGLGRERRSELGEDGLGLVLDGPPRHEPEACRLAADEQVRQDVEIREQAEFLEDDDDALARGIGRGTERDGCAPDEDDAVVWTLRAGEDLHERGFAGAVLADDGKDPAGVDRKVHPGQGTDAAVRLADARELTDGCGTRRRARQGVHDW